MIETVQPITSISDLSFDHERLKRWFGNEQRDLPWRVDASPYAVWISEIMLQQTQVSVVIPYFLYWMQQFPTIEALAKAPIEVVLKAWEGLGYYSRARNLHAGSGYIMQSFNGTLPSDPDKLKEIKGLGPYTIGAIRSFAFHQKTPAVDGNVMRVLSRYFGIHEDISKSATQKSIWNVAAGILPDEEHWIVNEGLIELGALICTKKPKCQICPIRASCHAHRANLAHVLPIKTAKVKVEKLTRSVAVVMSNFGRILVKQGEAGKVMSGLQEFPYFNEEGKPAAEGLQSRVESLLNGSVDFLHVLQEQVHSFTRFRVQLYPFCFYSAKEPAIPGYEWMAPAQLDLQPFSSGHRRVYSEWKSLSSS